MMNEKKLKKSIKEQLEDDGAYFDNLDDKVSQKLSDKSTAQYAHIFDEKVEPEPSQTKESIDILTEEFSKEQLKWTNFIETEAKKLIDFDQLTEVQVALYTHRQFAIELKTKLQFGLSKLNKKLKTEKKLAFTHNKLNNDFNLRSSQDMGIFVDDIVKNWDERRQLIEYQISFFLETINTIDKIIFGIKNRLDFERIKMGSTLY